jgi:heat shock protein HslJ
VLTDFIHRYGAVAAVLSLGVGCSAPSKTSVAAPGMASPASANLVGPTWRLTSLEGQPALPAVRVTAVFGSDGSVSGSAGCNTYTGTAVIKGDGLQVGPMATTRMFCGEGGVMDQEDRYLSVLGEVGRYALDGARLQIGPASGSYTLVFSLQ